MTYALRSSLMVGFSCLLFAGCGPTGVKVGGNIVSKGSAYKIPEGDNVQVMISDDKSNSFSATVGADGKFSINDGKPVPPVTYQVRVMVYKGMTKGKAVPPTPKEYPDSWNVETTPNFTLDMAKLK